MIKKREKRVLLAASHSKIENLGLIYLLGIARDEDCDRRVVLVKDHNFEPFFEAVNDFKPDIVGFNSYTGAHLQLFNALDRLKKDYPKVVSAVGGPHATYFPQENLEHADFVVMSEGFKAFRRILRGEVKPGILDFIAERDSEPFPHPDRETFYRDSPEHAKSPIKSIITTTGCPFSCTYCYNSTERGAISLNPSLLSFPIIGQQNKSARLFPINIRTTQSVIKEGREISEKWPQTKLVYVQDDVFGLKISKHKTDGTPVQGSLEELSERWPNEVGIPLHAQMRWEMTIKNGEKRLDLAKKTGVTGLTLAIEAENEIIRKEVLNRKMSEESMFKGMRRIIDRGMTVRTEQITALPYGATSKKTPINLDADIALIELNRRLTEESGGPTMAWFSTFAPYKGTKITMYCAQNGHYEGDNNDVPDAFFKRSVLRFPREWVGPQLAQLKSNPRVWLPPDELEKYRDQNAQLINHGTFFTLVPDGHVLARKYLTSPEHFNYQRLGDQTKQHLQELEKRGNLEARTMLDKIDLIKGSNHGLDKGRVKKLLLTQVHRLAPVFAALPKSDAAISRATSYALEGDGHLATDILSKAIRQHLYDEALYHVGSDYFKPQTEKSPIKI